MRKSFALLALMLALGLSGCSYYQVTDSDTGAVYVTNDMCKVKKSQKKAVTFKEKISGEKVTLQSPAVEKIARATYKAEVKAIKEAAAAPAQ